MLGSWGTQKVSTSMSLMLCLFFAMKEMNEYRERNAPGSRTLIALVMTCRIAVRALEEWSSSNGCPRYASRDRHVILVRPRCNARKPGRPIFFFESYYARWAFGLCRASTMYVCLLVTKYRLFLLARLCWPPEVARMRNSHGYVMSKVK